MASLITRRVTGQRLIGGPMFIQAFRKPNSLENDSLLTQIQDIDPTRGPLILAQNKQMTRSELMKGFLTSLTKQTLIRIHSDFKLKPVVDTVTSWKGVCKA